MDESNPYLPPQTNPEPERENAPLPSGPAGFWMRSIAVVIDWIIVLLIGYGIGQVAIESTFGEDSTALEISSNYFGIILSWLYGAILESSTSQATLGKRIMGLKVTDLEGNRISFARASGRHFAKYLTWMTLLIGYIIMLWTDQKQTLHDFVAGCLVRDVD